jgi:hypothetical protein
MRFNTIDTLKNVMVSGCGEEIHIRELAKLDKVKMKKDAHTSDVTSTRLKMDKLNNILLLTGSKDKSLNLFKVNDEFPKCDPLNSILTGETILQANLFGKDDYFFDIVTKDHTHLIYSADKSIPLVNFKGKNVKFE